MLIQTKDDNMLSDPKQFSRNDAVSTGERGGGIFPTTHNFLLEKNWEIHQSIISVVYVAIVSLPPCIRDLGEQGSLEYFLHFYKQCTQLAQVLLA